MSTAHEKWAAMTARERDAWVAEHVIGWRWITDGRRCLLQPPERIATMLPEYVFMFSQIADKVWEIHGLVPSYTTDASADYLVLTHVRETWDESALRAFAWHFHSITGLRSRTDAQRAVFALMYEPGNYSHAAYLVIQERTSEQ